MRADRIVKRDAQRAELERYKTMFKASKPLLDAMAQLQDAFNQGVVAENTRILSATKNLTYEETT